MTQDSGKTDLRYTNQGHRSGWEGRREIQTDWGGLTSMLFSSSTWSYSLREAKNMSDVTFSKQWIHFRLSDFWPPTSTILRRKKKVVRLFILETFCLNQKHSTLTVSPYWFVPTSLLSYIKPVYCEIYWIASGNQLTEYFFVRKI